jgi:hypothetical protein
MTSRRGKLIKGLTSPLRETVGSAAARMRVQVGPMVEALMSLSVSGISAASSPRKAHIMSEPKLVGHTRMTSGSALVQPMESKVPHCGGFGV